MNADTHTHAYFISIKQITEATVACSWHSYCRQATQTMWYRIEKAQTKKQTQGEGASTSCCAEGPLTKISFAKAIFHRCMATSLFLDGRFSLERNCVLRRWESETLK